MVVSGVVVDGGGVVVEWSGVVDGGWWSGVEWSGVDGGGEWMDVMDDGGVEVVSGVEWMVDG